MKTEYFTCQCYSCEHTLRFDIDLEDDPHVYTSVYLNQYRNVFKRIWIAIKYIFGYKCNYGHWDCFELKTEDMDRLIGILKECKEVIENKETENEK